MNVARPTRIKNGKRIRSEFYRGKFRLDGDAKPTYVALRVRQKTVALEKLKRIVEQKERERYGLAPSEKEHKLWTRDLVSVVQDYISDLHAAGRDIKYVSNVRSRISILMRSLGWRALNQVSAEDFQGWRAAQSKAAKTLNEYLDAILRVVELAETAVGDFSG